MRIFYRPKAIGTSRMAEVGIYVSLGAISVFILFPFVWIIVCSFKPLNTLFSVKPSWIPNPPTIQNYLWALSPVGPNIPGFLRNTVVAATLCAIVTGVLSSLAAYGLSRFDFPARELISILVISFQMFNGPLVIISWYRIGRILSLLDSPAILVLAYVALSVPVCTWLLMGFFQKVPRELEEAAMIDGCSRMRAITRVIVPITAPGVAAITLYAFILAWNDYLYAVSLTQTLRSMTIQVGLYQLASTFGQVNWGGVLAAGVITTLPAVMIFMFLQRYIITGLTAGAVKG